MDEREQLVALAGNSLRNRGYCLDPASHPECECGEWAAAVIDALGIEQCGVKFQTFPTSRPSFYGMGELVTAWEVRGVTGQMENHGPACYIIADPRGTVCFCGLTERSYWRGFGDALQLVRGFGGFSTGTPRGN